jgi:hypothetical protein
MAAPRNRKHILLGKSPRVSAYTSHGAGGSSKIIPEPDIGRPAHGAALKTALLQTEADAKSRRAHAGMTVAGAIPGIYVQFESRPGIALNVSSLENLRPRDAKTQITLVACTQHEAVSDNDRKPVRVEQATVFVPDGQVKHFVSRFEKYALASAKKPKEIRHEDMIDRIATLRLATLRSLWTDDLLFPEENQSIWWEVWLRRTDGRELERLHEFASNSKAQVGSRRLQFGDRIVTLVFTTAEKLSISLDVLNDIAEVRKAKELASFFVDQPSYEQAGWAKDLRGRLVGPSANAPAVCLLDTGITRAHPLLDFAIAPSDVHAVEPAWGTADDGGGPDRMGHGTEMAGIALYGDLAAIIASTGPVSAQHRLESVKILPPARFGVNNPELYGAVTATAISYPEVDAQTRKRVFSMAVTARDNRDRGQPTSWSAAIDALAAGRFFDATKSGLTYLGEPGETRLFVISAGNVKPEDLRKEHLDRSDTEPVHDPAQAWNALTVGAFTDYDAIDDPGWKSWAPLAAKGELSPFSTTSVVFGDRWPIKPDVVAEGGNAAINGRGEITSGVADLSLLTTHYRPHERLLVTTQATSPATSQVARICAIIAAEYPQLWPETIRALVVQSAHWTPCMLAQMNRFDGKRQRGTLVRRYGFGVPSLERALRSASNALTLITQASIRPFLGPNTVPEMHLYDLPWPRSELERLGETIVRLRVTLSYFVEPNPGRRGWFGKYRYPSHGLRFDVKGPLESTSLFTKRINKRALEEHEDKPTKSPDDGWMLGEKVRNHGSLHSDWWEGTAAELAARGVLAVYPVAGWWKKDTKNAPDVRVRYALVVSIVTPDLNVDIWTPVAQQVGVAVEITPISI